MTTTTTLIGSSKTRTVLEPHSEFDLQSPSISSLSLTSISDSETLLHVGTRTGTVILLSSNPTQSSSPSLSQNASFRKSIAVSDSSVQFIHPISPHGIVLILSDGCLYLSDLKLAQPVKKLAPLKGISLITPRVKSNAQSVTSSSSGSYTHLSIENESNYSSDISSRFLMKLGSRTNGVKMKELDGTHVFSVVIGRKLVLVELVIENKESIVSGNLVILKEIQCAEGVKTMVWINDSIIVGTFSGYTLVSCVTGHSGLIFGLPDLNSLPILKVLKRDFRVLLLVDKVGVIVDVHGQPVGGSLVFRGAPDSVGEMSSYLGVARDGKMELYNKKSGVCVQTVSFAAGGVGTCIVADEDDGKGKLLAVATPSKLVCYRRIPSEEQIKDLLRKKNFEEAISLVEELESEGEMTKEMLSFVHAQVGFLLLFDLHFEEAVDHFLQSDTMQPSELFPFIMRDPNRRSLLGPRNRYWGLHPPPAPLEDVVDDGLLAIQRAIYLKKAGVETAIDANFLRNPPSRAELLESAINNIIRYLQISRGKDLTSSVREGVDTLLMYLYRALNCVNDMEKLASSENSCIVEELEGLLDESGHLRTLAFLYASKGMDAKALAIWRILAKNYSSGLWKGPSVETESEDSSAVVIAAEETAATEASKILEDSSDQDLILQHLGWIAEVNQVLAIQVLTSEKRASQLAPDEVASAIDPNKVDILQSYLQWLIQDQDCYDTRFHTTYALSLANSALEKFEAEKLFAKHVTGRSQELVITDVEGKSIFQSSVRERLQIFLQSSDLYDPVEVLELIEGSDLWLEKAILYRKLGQETLVLQILALKLEDCEAAEQYCREIGRPDAYMQLLDMYLDPQEGKEPMFKAAVRLLHNHGESLDPLQVLETLSADMPLQLASDTILRMLRARIHHHRQGQIVHNLSRAVDTDAKLARLEERSRYVQINDDSTCDSCHARLGTKLFAMYPDDTIVCYKCYRRQGDSTSVTGRDFKQDPLIKPGWLTTR